MLGVEEIVASEAAFAAGKIWLQWNPLLLLSPARAPGLQPGMLTDNYTLYHGESQIARQDFS